MATTVPVVVDGAVVEGNWGRFYHLPMAVDWFEFKEYPHPAWDDHQVETEFSRLVVEGLKSVEGLLTHVVGGGYMIDICMRPLSRADKLWPEIDMIIRQAVLEACKQPVSWFCRPLADRFNCHEICRYFELPKLLRASLAFPWMGVMWRGSEKWRQACEGGGSEAAQIIADLLMIDGIECIQFPRNVGRMKITRALLFSWHAIERQITELFELEFALDALAPSGKDFLTESVLRLGERLKK